MKAVWLEKTSVSQKNTETVINRLNKLYKKVLMMSKDTDKKTQTIYALEV